LVTSLVSLMAERGLNPTTKFVNDRPGHDFRYALDSNKATRHLNWNPVGFSNQSLGSIIDWYLTNEDWWRKYVTNLERVNYK
ncbi:MAG: hypothetical protein ACKPE1_14135, partial [Dolichospermum sp.]